MTRFSLRLSAVCPLFRPLSAGNPESAACASVLRIGADGVMCDVFIMSRFLTGLTSGKSVLEFLLRPDFHHELLARAWFCPSICSPDSISQVEPLSGHVFTYLFSQACPGSIEGRLSFAPLHWLTTPAHHFRPSYDSSCIRIHQIRDPVQPKCEGIRERRQFLRSA